MLTFGFRNRMSGMLRAVAAIILGVVMIAMPDSSLVILVQILAAILIASGLVSVIYGVYNRRNGGLGLMVFNSIVDIVLGILIFCFPSAVASFIILVLGILLLALGLMQIFSLVSAVSFVRLGVLAFIFPVLCVLGGILLIFKPFGVATAITLVAGIALLVYGVSDLISTWKMRKAMKEYEVRFGDGGSGSAAASDSADSFSSTDSFGSTGTAGTSETSDDLSGVKDVDYEKVDSPEEK